MTGCIVSLWKCPAFLTDRQLPCLHSFQRRGFISLSRPLSSLALIQGFPASALLPFGSGSFRIGRGHPVHGALASVDSVPVACPQLWPPEMSPDLGKCLVMGRIIPGDNHYLNIRKISRCSLWSFWPTLPVGRVSPPFVLICQWFANGVERSLELIAVGRIPGMTRGAGWNETSPSLAAHDHTRLLFSFSCLFLTTSTHLWFSLYPWSVLTAEHCD